MAAHLAAGVVAVVHLHNTEADLARLWSAISSSSLTGGCRLARNFVSSRKLKSCSARCAAELARRSGVRPNAVWESNLSLFTRARKGVRAA